MSSGFSTMRLRRLHVDGWLPEPADRRVLRRPDGPLECWTGAYQAIDD